MEKGRDKNEYCQRATGKKQPDASNKKEESYNNSFENGTDSTHVNVSRYQSMVSLSSGTLDILELGPNSKGHVRTRTGQSGLRARKELFRKSVVGRNGTSPRKQRQRSSEQHRLHPKHLRASKRPPLSFRAPSGCRTTPVSLTSSSKAVHLSGRTSKFPRQRKPKTHSQCINTSPNRYANIDLANNKPVLPSPKPSRYQLTSPKPSQKSKIPKPVNSNTAKSYIIPKSNEIYTKGNANILPGFNGMSITSWDLNKRDTSLESPSAKKSPKLTNIQASPSLSPSRNLSNSSSKTSKCTGRASTVSQASKLKSGIVGVRSKQPLIQRPQFLKRKEKASKSKYQLGKPNRGSKMTAARRRKLSRDRNHAKLSLSLPDSHESLSTQRREKASKPLSVPGDTIIKSKTKTKPACSAKRRRSQTTSYNKGPCQKKATSMSARSKSAASHEKESAKETPSSLTASPKRKLTRTSPKSGLPKYGPNRSDKGRSLRGTRTRPCKSPASNTSRRALSVVRDGPRSRASLAAHSRSGVGFNSLGVYKSHSLHRSPENVQETSFLFKFQSKRWLLKPSTQSVVECGEHEGTSNTERRDCFAAWKLTKHEVLQSCSSEDLLILNNTVKQSSPHSHSGLSRCNKSRKTQTPKPDTFLDHQKQVVSLDHQKPVVSLDHQKPVVSLDHQKQVVSLDHQKPVTSLDRQKPVNSLDHQKPVNSLDHQKPNNTVDNQKAATIRQETRLYFISGVRPLLSLKVQSVHSMSNTERKSNSEYTSSTDTCSVTSKWSLGSSICSSTSPTKRQYSSICTSWPVKSWSCVYCLQNQRKRRKRRGYLIRPKTELENKKEDSFKYSQFSRTPAQKAKPNRLNHQREHFRMLKTSLEFSNSTKNKNKQGKRYLPENSAESPPRFVKRSSYRHGFRSERSPSAIQNKNMKPPKPENRPLHSKLGRLISCTVEPEDVTMEQISLVRYNSADSQKQTLQPSWSPAVKPKQDTSSTISRVAMRDSQRRLSEAKKWGLAAQSTQESRLRVWKWRLLAVAFILLLAMCYYCGCSDDNLDLS